MYASKILDLRSYLNLPVALVKYFKNKSREAVLYV